MLLDIPVPEMRRRALEAADASVLRRRACLALRELLARVSQKQQVVVIIDDLQWTDEESMGLFDVLLEPAHAPPVLLLAAWRTDAGQPVRLQGVRELPLERLIACLAPGG
ncbi:MAG: AAA family ATPase [Candidatus Xenobia bacterium]